jgi:hypothetical protein
MLNKEALCLSLPVFLFLLAQAGSVSIHKKRETPDDYKKGQFVLFQTQTFHIVWLHFCFQNLG